MAKRMTGVVVSNSMEKTIVVKIQQQKKHPLYKKVMTRHKKFLAHVEGEKPLVGAMVTITETRPYSKNTHFVLEKVHTRS